MKSAGGNVTCRSHVLAAESYCVVFEPEGGWLGYRAAGLFGPSKWRQGTAAPVVQRLSAWVENANSLLQRVDFLTSHRCNCLTVVWDVEIRFSHGDSPAGARGETKTPGMWGPLVRLDNRSGEDRGDGLPRLAIR